MSRRRLSTRVSNSDIDVGTAARAGTCHPPEAGSAEDINVVEFGQISSAPTRNGPVKFRLTGRAGAIHNFESDARLGPKDLIDENKIAVSFGILYRIPT